MSGWWRGDAGRVEKLETDARALRAAAEALEACGQPADLLRDAAEVAEQAAESLRGSS